MKKCFLLILAIVFLLSACSGAGEPLADVPVIAEPAGVETESLSTTPPQEILGKWLLDMEQSTGAGSVMLDPLESEIYEAAGMEITSDYLIFNNFGHTYSWIDDQRIRVDGVMLGFGSATEGLFYVFTVQRDGDTLRFLLVESAPQGYGTPLWPRWISGSYRRGCLSGSARHNCTAFCSCATCCANALDAL
jgi:hypothetical protein